MTNASGLTPREVELKRMTYQELIENLSATFDIANEFNATMTEAFRTQCQEEKKMILAELEVRTL